MTYPYPNPLFENVRDHLERAVAILHKDHSAISIRNQIEEAIDMTLECAYRPSSRPSGHHLSSRPNFVLEAANDDGAGR